MFAAQAATELRLALRNGEQVLLTLVIPVLLLVGLTVLDVVPLPEPRVAAVTPSVLALAVMSTAFTSQAIALGFDRRYGVIRRLAATALPRWLLVAGRLAAVLATVAVQVVVLAALAAVLGWRPAAAGLGWALLLVLLGCAAFGALGLLLGGTLRADVVLAVANAVWFVLLLAGGIVVPLDRLPGPVAATAALLPSGALAEGLRTVLTTGSGPGAGPVLVLARLDGGGHRTGGPDRPPALIPHPGPYDRRVARPALLDRLVPVPPAVVRRLAIAAVIAQAGIAVTGSIVRVTGSGLGCPTWPQCFPGSLVPTPHPEVAALHQWVEFGNRLLTFAVVAVTGLCFLAALSTRPRRPRLVRLALVQPLGVVAQAVIGGFTVLLGLVWWSVSVHFLVSMALVWLAVVLVSAVDRGRRATAAGRAPGRARPDGDLHGRARGAAARRHLRHGRGPALGRRRHAAAGRRGSGHGTAARGPAVRLPRPARRAGLRAARRHRTGRAAAALRGAGGGGPPAGRRRWGAVRPGGARGAGVAARPRRGARDGRGGRGVDGHRAARTGGVAPHPASSGGRHPRRAAPAARRDVAGRRGPAGPRRTELTCAPCR